MKSDKLSSKKNRRLNALKKVTCGAVACGGLVSVNTANAAINQVNFLPGPVTTDNDTRVWDVDGQGSANDFTFGVTASSAASYGFIYGAGANSNGFVAVSAKMVKLNGSIGNIGDPVGTAQSFKASWYGGVVSSGSVITSQFAVGMTDGFVNDGTSDITAHVGFRFKADAIGTEYHYGWAEILLNWKPVDNGGLTRFTIEDGYYNTELGASINVGQTQAVPEPSEVGIGIGLLALGCAGVHSYRRRKKAEQAQAS